MSLTLKIEREVLPKEVTSLVYGTGALSYPWWVEFEWTRDGKRLLVSEHNLDEALETDVFVVVIDDPEEAEGSGITKRVELTMQQIVDAAGLAIRKGYVYETDAIKDDLGYCDAEQADLVLQMAALGKDEAVYG